MSLSRSAAVVAALVLGLTGCGGTSSTTAPICTDATTCPVPSSACLSATCAGGQCGETPKPVGTKISDPTPGDCKSNQCDGSGHLAAANDDGDLPSASSDCNVGLCVAGVPGQSPRPAGSVCTSNGGVLCDGAGSCVQCVSGSDCASGVCSTGTCQAASCADGVKNGNETAVDCGGGICAPCPDGTTCQGGTDCSSGACRGNVCAAPLGTTCAMNATCASGFCVDGVCCNSACAGGCQQCNAPGAAGSCTSAVAGSDPRNACTATSQASCGSTDFCNGAGACAVWSAGTTCAPASCSGGVATPASSCDGLGTCQAAASVSCGNYQCGATTCLTSCTANLQCIAPATCIAGACQ